jgi:hypothetical protein
MRWSNVSVLVLIVAATAVVVPPTGATVNGVREGATSVPNGVSASGPLVIGAAWSGGTRADRLGGAINDVRAWERVLSDAEVAQLYAAGAS